MKQYLTITFIILVICAEAQQGYQELSYGAPIVNAEELDALCPPENSNGLGFNSEDVITKDGAEKIVNKILNDLGIPNQYKLRECKAWAEGNAFAKTFVRNGKTERYILYDVDFLNDMANKMVGDNNAPAAATFILAHEVAHHLKDHTLDFTGSNPEIEIEADWWAAYTMAKRKYSLEEVLRTPKTEKRLVTNEYISNHPGRIDRMQAAFEGWMSFAENDSTLLLNNRKNIRDFQEEIYELKVEAGLIKKEDNSNAKNASQKNMLENVTVKNSGAAEVIKRYFQALGGIAKVNEMTQLSYTETTNRSDENKTYKFRYQQLSPTKLLVNTIEEFQPYHVQYLISNDTLYNKWSDKKSWKEGLPKGERLNQESFKRFIGSSTGDFLEDFNLFGSPDLVALIDTVQFNKISCFKLEVKEKLEEVNLDKNRTGSHSRLQQFRYYRADNGLLAGIEKIKTKKNFRRGAMQGIETISTTILNSHYKDVNGIKFPHQYQITQQTKEGNAIKQVLEIKKIVSDIEFGSRESQ